MGGSGGGPGTGLDNASRISRAFATAILISWAQIDQAMELANRIAQRALT